MVNIKEISYSKIHIDCDGIERVYLLCSNHDEDYLNRWVKINAVSDNQALIMFGIGNGMYAKKMANSEMTNGRIIIVEPSDEILKAVSKDIIDEIEESEQITVLCNSLEDMSLNKSLYNILITEKIKNIKVAIYPNYHLIFPEVCAKFLQVVDEVWDMASAGEIVDDRFSEIIRNNTSININRLDKSLSIAAFARKVPKDIPVIIAASGPSLSKNVGELKRAKGKSFIVGLDSSLPALLAEDIIPDVYISIDPTKIAKHFEDERIKSIPAVLLLQSPEHVVKEGQKYFFIFNGDEEILEKLKSDGVDAMIVPPLGSVANSAFTLINKMGFNTVILVGQDLAYTNDKYHADNTVHDEKIYKQDTVIMLPGVFGDEVKSSREFRMYKSGFEKIIEMCPDHRIIDATEGGAYICGTEILKLSEVIDDICIKETDMSKYFEDLPLLIQ